MIHELTGDLLLSKAEVLVHGLAPDDDCKQGLARALRERFPAMYKDFRHWCRIAGPKPGSMWSWQGVDANGRTVHLVALLTQEPPEHAGAHPGRATTASVNHALHELRKWLDREKPRSVAMPAIATGVGGLPWNQVAPLLQSQLGGTTTQIYVYTRYAPGVAATEPVPVAN